MTPKAFLSKHNFIVENINTVAMVNDFLIEMEAGLRGEPSSLSMLPAYIKPVNKLPIDQEVCTLDAGGTNVRSARITFTKEGTVRMRGFHKDYMPGSCGEVSNNAFYQQLSKVVSPNLHSGETFGFCFSYSTEILPNRDGCLTKWSKNIEAPGIVRTCVGGDLKTYMTSHGLAQNTTPILLNDTVATLLAAYSMRAATPYSAYIGFILGTGVNTAYCENTEAITKINSSIPYMTINCESGNFAKVPQSDFDKELDETSQDPGGYLLEKTMSGVFLGRLGTIILTHAAEEGLFSDEAAALIRANTYTNIQLDSYCAAPNELFGTNPIDQQTAIALIRPIYVRAAIFAAVNLAATTIKAKKASRREGPVCINADGSTFHKTAAIPFKKIVKEYLDQLLLPHGITYEIIMIDDAPLIGAAIAALSYADV